MSGRHGPVERARRAAAELLAAYQAARTVDEREDVARMIACLMPGSSPTLAEMAERALAEAKAGR